jgi:hypothetical protein
VGVHSLHAQLAGDDVEGTPLSITAMPGGACLAASRADEGALTSAVAGRPSLVMLTAFNEFGHPVGAGGAPLSAALRSACGAPLSPRAAALLGD